MNNVGTKIRSELYGITYTLSLKYVTNSYLILGNLEWGSYTGDFERSLKESSRNGVSFSEEALWRQPGGRAPVLVTRKDILSKDLEMDVCFHMGPRFGGTRSDAPFLWPLRKGKKFLYLGKFL